MALLAVGLVISTVLYNFERGPGLASTNTPPGVIDSARVISDSNEMELEQIIAALEATNGAELFVVTLSKTDPAYGIEGHGQKLYKRLKMGKPGVDNGVLLLVVEQDRTALIKTGSAIEAALSEAQVQSILETEVLPQLKDGNFDRSVLQGVGALLAALQDVTFEPSGWKQMSGAFFSPVWRVAIAYVSLISLMLWIFSKTRAAPFRLEPTGRSTLPRRYRHPTIPAWVYALGGLPASNYRSPDDLLAGKIAAHYEERLSMNLQLTFLTLLVGLLAISGQFLHYFAGPWMGLAVASTYGEFCWHHWNWYTGNRLQNLQKTLRSATPLYLLVSVLGVLPCAVLILLTRGVAMPFTLFFLSAWLGTFALMPRVGAIHRPDFTPYCQTCRGTMEPININHLFSHPDRSHEGYYCRTCLAGKTPTSAADVHIISQDQG